MRTYHAVEHRPDSQYPSILDGCETTNICNIAADDVLKELQEAALEGWILYRIDPWDRKPTPGLYYVLCMRRPKR